MKKIDDSVLKFYVTLKKDKKRYRMYRIDIDRRGKFVLGTGELMLPNTDTPEYIFPNEIIGDLEIIND